MYQAPFVVPHVGLLVVVFSVLVMVFNIGVPNHMKGFLFYAQVRVYYEPHCYGCLTSVSVV